MLARVPAPPGDLMDDDLPARLPFLDATLPSTLKRRTVTLEPGERLGYDPVAWRDALVVIEQGIVELECSAGGHRHFTAGDILWLAGLPLLALHNDGADQTVIVAISRDPSQGRAARPDLDR